MSVSTVGINEFVSKAGTTFKVGHIIRFREVHDGFSDTLILAFGESDEGRGIEWVRLARPYVYVSGANSVCRSALTGVENFWGYTSQLDNYDIIEPNYTRLT